MGREWLDLAVLTQAGEHSIGVLADLLAHVDSPSFIVTSIVSVGELHTSALIRGIMTVGHGNVPVGQPADVYKSWESRLKWLGQAVNVNLLGQRSVQRFKICVDLRNILLHGGGGVTVLQEQDIDRVIRLRKDLVSVLGAHFVGRRILVDGRVVSKAALALREYISFLDRLVIARHPDIAALSL